jgi:hypothetical protein
MAINLLETVRKNLGIPELKKVDPNTQQVVVKTNEEKESRLMQSLIPTALAGIYDCVRSEEGLNFLAGAASHPDWISLLFGKNEAEMKQRLAAYSGTTTDFVQSHFNMVATETVKVLRENAKGDDRKKAIRALAGSQRDLILPYLPAELKAGWLLEDETMDDRTNKMEGPVSTLMHKIETAITGQESKEDADKKRDAKM